MPKLEPKSAKAKAKDRKEAQKGAKPKAVLIAQQKEAKAYVQVAGKRARNEPKDKDAYKRKSKYVKPRELTPDELKQKRKESKKHYDAVTEAKAIWEKMRVKTLDAEERTEMCDHLMKLIEGKIYEIAVRHDASRIVQSAIQFCNEEQRGMILAELKGNFVELSKFQYSRFLVTKMIRYSKPAQREAIVKEFDNNMIKMGTHSVAAQTIEFVRTWVRPAVWAQMRQEFYGQEFGFFKSDEDTTLQKILGKHPDKLKRVTATLGRVMSRMADKNLLALSFVQNLLWEHFLSGGADAVVPLIPTVADAVLALVSTRDGARCAAECLAYGSAKQRKQIIKLLKGKVLDAAVHQHGYLMILRLLDVVDDTVLVKKAIFSELKDELLDVATHACGHKVLMHVLAPRSAQYFDPEELSLLQPAMVRESAAALPNAATDAGEGSEDEDDAAADAAAAAAKAKAASKTAKGEEQPLVSTSRKTQDMRRKELLQVLRVPLEAVCVANAHRLLRSKYGSRVLLEVVKVWASKAVVAAVVEAALSAGEAAAADGADGAGDVDMAEAGAGGEEDEEEKGDSSVPMCEDKFANRILEKLVTGAGEEEQSEFKDPDAADFGVLLCQRLLEGKGEALVEWAQSAKGAFIVAGLLGTLLDPAPAKKVLKAAAVKKQLTALAKKNKAVKAVLKLL
jgi:pumilio family protein 6